MNRRKKETKKPVSIVCPVQWSNYWGPEGAWPLKDRVAPRNTWFERVQGGL